MHFFTGMFSKLSPQKKLLTRLVYQKQKIIIEKNQSSYAEFSFFLISDSIDVWHTCKLMTVLAKKTLLYVPFFGQSAYLADIIFIDRHSSTAKETMNKAMKRLKEKNIKLWVFPEGDKFVFNFFIFILIILFLTKGTRRNTGAIHEFKKGAFHTAIEEELPIVPVVFSSYQHFLDTTRKSFDEGEIIITALPEISTKGMTFRDLDKLIEQVKSDMTEVYNRTSRETLQKSLK